MDVQLGGVAVNVADLDRSIAFYEGVLGLTVLARIELATMTEVVLGPAAGAPGSPVMLVQHADRGGPADPSDGVEKLYFVTSDVQALYDRAVEAGAEAIAPPTRASAFPVTVAFVQDPDEYKIELVESGS